MSDRKDVQFDGFSAETIFFLKNLRENNNREWFLARKKDYYKKVVQPAGYFVQEMGVMLKNISPGIQAVPKIDRSICRIYQDPRFAKDQNPYRSYLGIWFWYGARRGKKSPGYYFELRPDQLYLSAGTPIFSRKALRSFRNAAIAPESGAELNRIIEKIQKNQNYQTSKAYYENIPEGYEESKGKFDDLIRFNGLVVSWEMAVPPEIYNRNLLKFIFHIYKEWSPLFNWLIKQVYSEDQ